MNCEPCNSLEITCNHNVTIGYLKELVAIIPDACCTKITVTGNDSYCPTYGELTNGSIIPYFSDGGTNAWSNNVDGITINGGYSNNQCVAKKDLKLIYTAFESLTVANSSPVVSECGGATTTTRTLTFRKYTKECDKASTSTTQTDTTLRVTWSGTDSSSTGTKTYSRNTSFSDTHASTVSCSISWRGCSHTSNSISVSQKVRAFDHNVDYSRSAGESVDVYCYPSSFNCDGGTSYASATYYYTTWTERHYIDTCGVDYNQENINYRYNNTRNVDEYLNVASHNFTKCTTGTTSFKFEASYDGFSDEAYATMECPSCETCPPTDYTEYSYITASCSDLSATVSGVTHTFSGGGLDGEGKCTGSTESTANTSYTVSWQCNTDGGWVDTYVYVSGAPCCTTGVVYTYGVATIPCDSGTNVEASTTYTATTYHKDGTTTTETGPTSCTISNVECNSGSERELSTDCPFTVKQSGGCTCTAPCECTALTLASTTASVTVGSTTDVTFTAGCTTGHTVASSDNTVATATVGNGKVTITGVKAGTATITLSYTAGTTSCSSAITTTVTTACGCNNFAISPTSLEWEASSTASKEVSITESGSCISGVQVSSSNSHFTASISGDKITVTPTAATSSSEETGTLTVSYKANGSDCTPSKTVSLRHKPCTCDDFALTQTTNVQQSATTYQIIGTYELGCVGDSLSWTRYSSSSSQYVLWKDALTWDGNAIWKSQEEEVFVVNDMYFSNGNIYVKPYQNNSSSSRTETVEVSGSYFDYAQGTNVTCTKLFTITQNGLAPVTCDTQSCTCYKVGNATASVNATATSATVTFPYTAITWTTASTCDVSSASTTGSSSQTVTFAASTCDNYSKSGSFTWTNHKACGTDGCGNSDVIVNWYVTQTKPSDCCGCGDFSIDTSSMSWYYNDTSSKTINITSGSCISSISVNSLTYFNTSISSDKITITPKGSNTSTSDHDETLIISYNAKGSTCPTKSVSLTQYGAPCQYSQCTCYEVSEATLKNGTSISSGATSAEVEWSYTAMTYTTNYDCTTSGYESSTGTSSTTITGIATNNTCSDIVRNGSFTWNGYTECYSNDCGYSDATIYWNVTQNRGKEATDPECTGCYCSGFTLGSYPSAWTCSSTSTQYVYYTGSCQTQITASSNGTHFSASADTSNNRIVVYPNSINNTNAKISETITVSYYANGSSCPNKTFQVNHESGSTCYCPDNCDSITAFSITKTSLDVGGSTSWDKIGEYSVNSACSDKVGATTTASWITALSASSGSVYAKYNANSSYSQPNSATIVLTWNGTSCSSKSGNVTQGVKPCTCSDGDYITSYDEVGYQGQNGFVVWELSANCGTFKAVKGTGTGSALFSNVGTGYTNGHYVVSANVASNSSTSQVSCEIGYEFYKNSSDTTPCTSDTITVYVGAHPCDCTTANFNVDTTTKNVLSGASTLAATIKYSADCGTVSATVVSGGDWITGLKVYQSSVYHDVDLEVTANNGPERSGSVKVYLVGYESDCSDIVQVVQAPGPTPVTCYCSALTLSNTSVSVNAGASTSVTYSADCVSITSIAASSTGITIDTGTTGTIKITGNTSGDYTITIKSSAGGTTCTDKTISVTVTCPTITISPNNGSGDCSGGTQTFTAS